MCHCSFCLFSCSFRNWKISTLALLSQNSDLDLMLVRSAELAEIVFFFLHMLLEGEPFHVPCQTSIQGEVWPLQPITITSLLSTQRHFDWAYSYIHTYIRVGLGYMCGLALSKEINEL